MLNVIKILLAFVFVVILSNFVPHNSWDELKQMGNEISKYQNPSQNSTLNPITQSTANTQAMPPVLQNN